MEARYRPGNRLVRAALSVVSGRVQDAELAHRCRTLASDLGRLGVGGVGPSRGEITADRIGRHDADARLMVTLARIVFAFVLPPEAAGDLVLTQVEGAQVLARFLLERA